MSQKIQVPPQPPFKKIPMLVGGQTRRFAPTSTCRGEPLLSPLLWKLIIIDN